MKHGIGIILMVLGCGNLLTATLFFVRMAKGLTPFSDFSTLVMSAAITSGALGLSLGYYLIHGSAEKRP